MKKFYMRLRIFLLTFAFGLACVPFLNEIHKKWNEIAVDLPQVQSETPLYVFPKYRNEMPRDGGGGSGGSGVVGCDRQIEENKIEKKNKKERRK